jgi:YD repeat-containing protein
MPTKKLIILILFVLFYNHLSAQNTQNSLPYTFLNNMVQAAPNAAALGKYADFPVSYYSGVPGISVPLYDLKDGAITLPISLSYHASGIRVSELATWVGLGWAMNAGGMITRTVMGAPDEGTRKVATSTIGPRGYYRDSGLYKLPILPYPLSDGTSSDPGNNFQIYTAPSIAGTFLDCEPDIYTFNFNGHAGKFVFDEYRHPQLLEDDNLKIVPNYLNNAFLSFTIITPDGIKYIFGENSMYETTNPSSTSSGTDYDSAAPSSWVLTHIINPNTKDTATFTYIPETYTYRDLGSESNLYLSQAPTQTVDLMHIHTNSLQNACDLSGITLNFLSTTVSGLRLTTIKTKNFTIKFIANNLRTDLVSGSSSKAYSLDSVKVYNNVNTCIRQFALNHSYFISTHNTTSGVTPYLNQVGDTTTDRYRLKLLSMAEYSGDGLIQKPPYVFTYYETTQLPRRLSYDQDHWGFCNNWNGDRNSYFTPTVTAGICSNSTIGATRDAAFPAMQGFTLTSIQDPLGAVTNFVYEGNTASNSYPANSLVGGLRIKQITVTDNVSGKVKTRAFNYNNSGQLFRMPVYLTTLYNEFYWAQQMGLSGQYGYIGYSQAYTFWGILRQSQSVVPLQEPQGGHIGYANVTETFGANGEGGYTTRLFKVTATGTDSLSSRLLVNPFASYSYMKAIINGAVTNAYGLYGNNHFNDFSTDAAVQPQNLKYYNGYNINNYYPLAPQQVDLERGKLLSEQTYDSSRHEIESTDYTYGHTFHENPLIRGIKCYTSVTTVTGGNTKTWYALTYYKYHTGTSQLKSITKKSFKDNHYLTEVSNFGYESVYHTLQTSDTTVNSKGDVLIRKTYYSADYANSATPQDNAISMMQARNLLLPVSKRTWKNGNLIEGSIIKYGDIAVNAITDTLINPTQMYALETSNGLTPAQANENIALTGRLTTLVPNTYFIPKATFSYEGNSGKLINQQLANNKSQGISWSKQLNLPVTIVDNATNTATTTITQQQTTGYTSISLPYGSTQTYNTSFTTGRTGAVTFNLSFSGNPGTNPMAQVSCTLTGPNNYSSTIPICIASGTGNCSGYGSNYTVSGLAPGLYTVTAKFSLTQNLTCNIYVNLSYPTITNTSNTTGINEFYYEGFEESTISGIATGTGHTGIKYMPSPYTVNWTLPNSRSYVISYWYLSGGVWKFQLEQSFTGSLTLAGGTAYDDIRIHPSDAFMTNYIYNANGNITGSIDAKGATSYYEYDSFQRLINIKDKDGNIVKHVDYHYQGQ